MKLHLHLGAHKTATTHFQEVLERNRHLFSEDVDYISMEEFRSQLRWVDDRVNHALCGGYLKGLVANSNKVLVLSEENILGETKDIYSQLFLYSTMEKRLGSLASFFDAFDEVEIWFSVRSMDGYLPSIYSESLRHWPYRNFKHVFSGQYDQSWLPVVKQLCRSFPGSKVNVIRYEHYSKALPEVLKCIFNNTAGWDYLTTERPRSSMNHYACEVMRWIGRFIPRSKSSFFVKSLSNFMDTVNIGHKFIPFDESRCAELKDIYSRDVKLIQALDNVRVI